MNFLDILFPKRCVSCGRIDRYICDRCRKTIIPIAPNECICPVCGKPAIAGITHPRCRSTVSPDGLTSFFYYKDAVRSVIHSLKYRFVSDIVTEITDSIPFSSYEIRSLSGNPCALLLPVPLHVLRYRARGFNQSAVMGAEIAKRMRIGFRTDVLARSSAALPQVDMKYRKNRLRNIRHAFTTNGPVPKQGTVLLFDDVFTTGATIREAARTLKQSGASMVWAVTLAR